MNKFIIATFLCSFSIYLNAQILAEVEGDVVVHRNLGIGTLPSTQLHIYELDPSSSNGVVSYFQRFGAGDVGVSFSQEFVNAFGIIHPVGGGLAFYHNRFPGNNGILRMKIDNGGNVGIGNIQPLRTLHVGGRVRIDNVPTGTGSALLVTANGDIVKSTSLKRTANSFVSESSLKEELSKKDEQIKSLSKRIDQLEIILNKLVQSSDQ